MADQHDADGFDRSRTNDQSDFHRQLGIADPVVGSWIMRPQGGEKWAGEQDRAATTLPTPAPGHGRLTGTTCLCGKTYRRPDALQRHIRAVQEPPKFMCMICWLEKESPAFARRDHYRQHLRYFHKLPQEEINFIVGLYDMQGPLVPDEKLGLHAAGFSSQTTATMPGSNGQDQMPDVTDSFLSPNWQ